MKARERAFLHFYKLCDFDISAIFRCHRREQQATPTRRRKPSTVQIDALCTVDDRNYSWRANHAPKKDQLANCHWRWSQRGRRRVHLPGLRVPRQLSRVSVGRKRNEHASPEATDLNHFHLLDLFRLLDAEGTARHSVRVSKRSLRTRARARARLYAEVFASVHNAFSRVPYDVDAFEARWSRGHDESYLKQMESNLNHAFKNPSGRKVHFE